MDEVKNKLDLILNKISEIDIRLILLEKDKNTIMNKKLLNFFFLLFILYSRTQV